MWTFQKIINVYVIGCIILDLEMKLTISIGSMFILGREKRIISKIYEYIW